LGGGREGSGGSIREEVAVVLDAGNDGRREGIVEEEETVVVDLSVLALLLDATVVQVDSLEEARKGSAGFGSFRRVAMLG
jgi:hypothetical protein